MIKRFCFFLIFFTNIALGYNAFDEFIVHSEGILECIKEHSSSSYNDSLDQLNLLRKNYDKHSKLFESESANYLNKSKEDNKIPKILHFIWVGPKQFPEKSLNNIIKWKELHPDHKIYFWTDRLRIFPDNVFDNVIIKSILDFFNENDKDFRKLISFYKESTNYGEKSDLVRYMILKKIGGIYVDHDIKPLRSTSFFVENFSFFCILENIWPMVEQNYIKLSNAYIGTVKESKIIAKTIECIEKNWDISTRRLENLNIWSYSLQQNHPSKEFQNLLKTLVLFRTFLPFTEAVKSTNLEEDQIVLPPQFGAIKQNSSSKFIKSCLIDHSFDGAWTGLSEHKNFELDSKNRKKISKVLKKCNSNYIGLFFLLFSILVLLLIFRRKIFL